MCLLSTQEAQFKDSYAELKEDWVTAQQTNFIPRNTVNKVNTLLKCKAVAVLCNPEVVKYLVDLGYPAEQITFFSDDEIKQELFLQDEINCKILPLNMETIMKSKHKFDGGVINPPFKEVPNFFNIMNDLVDGNFIFVCPNKRLGGKDNPIINKAISIENFGQNAFDKEDIEVSVLLIDTDKDKNDTSIQVTSGDKQIMVKDIPGIPPHKPELIEDWAWACRVMDLNLPGYNAENGSGNVKDSGCPEVADGVKVIFQVGRSGQEFGLEKTISPDTPGIFGLGYHKMVVHRVGHYFSFKEAKYAGPEYGVGESVMAIICDSEEDAKEAVKYYNSDKVKKFIKASKAEKTHSKYFFSKLPHHMYSDKWDETI